MLPAQRLESLRTKHANVTHMLEKEEQRPASDGYYIQQLKKQKLYLKDLIEGIDKTENLQEKAS